MGRHHEVAEEARCSLEQGVLDETIHVEIHEVWRQQAAYTPGSESERTHTDLRMMMMPSLSLHDGQSRTSRKLCKLFFGEAHAFLDRRQ
mmetsp:Transcript_19480/g.45318  ORF Transcript_19480/g.45318 Transcript_19480/m.45318 type:complete len:89 (+) Transcript_19480:769-1035(+)